MPTVELLSGGLVTSRDASLLAPGEVTRAEDVMLLPGSLSVQKAYGRTLLSAAPATIDGLTYCSFDSTADKLVAVANGTYYTRDPNTSSSFTALTTGAGTTLDSVVMLNRAVLFSGSSSGNIVLLSNGTQRPQGLSPVSSSIGYTYTATGGTWPLGATALGYYDYWVTEVYKTATEDVESTFIGTPATVNVAAATALVTIYKPPFVNASATHWRVYRSNKKTNIFDAAFPTGFLIAELPEATLSFVDGSSTVISLTLPTTYGTSGVGTWTTPANILAVDSAVAISPLLEGIDTPTHIAVNNFGLVAASPITDITVRVNARLVPGTTPLLTVTISTDGAPAGHAEGQPKSVPLTGTLASYDLTGLWGRTWMGAELSNASNFTVKLSMETATQFVTGQVEIDYVQVSVSHGGTTAQQTITFPNINITAGPVKGSTGSNNKPPGATTGDIFQGAIVTNDVSSPTNIVWTLPGTLDYTPSLSLYRLALDTKEHDSIKCIKSLGSLCLIGSEGTVYRLNYLPVADDPEFNPGRAIDIVDPDDGVVSARAACRFVYNGEIRLFYAGQSNLRMTNGFTVDTATDDIIWRDLANPAALSSCFVENNHRNYEILVFYSAAGSSTVNKILRLSYHPTHLKNGKLKVVSVTNYAAKAAAAGIKTTGERVLYTASGSSVYLENSGLTDAAGGTIIPIVQTREIHQNEIGNEWELSKIGVHHQGGGSSLDIYSTTALANYPVMATDPQTLLMSSRMLSIIDNENAGGGITINITGRDDGKPTALDYLVLYPVEMGEASPLKQ